MEEGGEGWNERFHACSIFREREVLLSNFGIPKRGSVVVYLPQGHFEHVQDFPVNAFDIPPHVFCRVLDVKLHVSVLFPFFPFIGQNKTNVSAQDFLLFS